jgi:hypothetical protein
MLATNRSAMALAGGARTGVLITRIPTAAKIASKVVVNLASRSRMRNGSADRRRGGSSRNCGPGEPARRRSVVGYPEEVDLAGGVLDTEEDGQPGQGDRVEVEQVAGQGPVRRGAEELRPGSPGPSR